MHLKAKMEGLLPMNNSRKARLVNVVVHSYHSAEIHLLKNFHHKIFADFSISFDLLFAWHQEFEDFRIVRVKEDFLINDIFVAIRCA